MKDIMIQNRIRLLIKKLRIYTRFVFVIQIQKVIIMIFGVLIVWIDSFFIYYKVKVKTK